MPLIFPAPALEAKYDVIAGDRKVGVATFAILPRKGGGRTTRLRLALAGGAASEETNETDATGTLVRSVHALKGSRETVAYGPRGDATVTRTGEKAFVVHGPKGSRRDPSERWFQGIVPTPGTWATFQSLDPKARRWDEVKVRYVGREGKGHLVQQSRAMGSTTRFVLDDRGLPLSIEAGGLRLVRR